jgi:hypothetical protein
VDKRELTLNVLNNITYTQKNINSTLKTLKWSKLGQFSQTENTWLMGLEHH